MTGAIVSLLSSDCLMAIESEMIPVRCKTWYYQLNKLQPESDHDRSLFNVLVLLVPKHRTFLVGRVAFSSLLRFVLLFRYIIYVVQLRWIYHYATETRVSILLFPSN